MTQEASGGDKSKKRYSRASGSGTNFMSISDREFLAFIKGRRFYSMGQIARICGVAPRTVAMWMDRGRLNGYHIPSVNGEGLKDNERRVEKPELVRFLRAHGMPTRGIDDDRDVLLCVSPRVELSESLPTALGEYWTAIATKSPVIAASKLATMGIQWVVLDYVIGADHCADLITLARESAWSPGVLGIETEDRDKENLIRQGCDDTILPTATATMVAATVLGKQLKPTGK